MDTQNRAPGGDDRDLQDELTQDSVNDSLDKEGILPLPEATPADADGTNAGGA